jgi:hypothetical protein
MRTRVMVAVALPLLAGAVTTEPSRPEPAQKFELELHARDRGGVYISAWDGDPVISDHDASDGKIVTYHRFFIWADGCKWESTEALVPQDRDHYAYAYREGPLACPPGAIADSPTPRDGDVIVHPTQLANPITPLSGWARGWEPK